MANCEFKEKYSHVCHMKTCVFSMDVTNDPNGRSVSLPGPEQEASTRQTDHLPSRHPHARLVLGRDEIGGLNLQVKSNAGVYSFLLNNLEMGKVGAKFFFCFYSGTICALGKFFASISKLALSF